MPQAYADLSPTSRNDLDIKLRNLHDIIKRKKGSIMNEDEDLIFLKNVFREIPVFKDIPNNFKQEVRH